MAKYLLYRVQVKYFFSRIVSAYISLSTSICLANHLSISLSISQSIYLSTYLFICQSIYLPTYQSVCLTILIYLNINLHLRMQMYIPFLNGKPNHTYQPRNLTSNPINITYFYLFPHLFTYFIIPLSLPPFAITPTANEVKIHPANSSHQKILLELPSLLTEWRKIESAYYRDRR